MEFTIMLAALAIGYLLGSIPFGVLLTKAAGAGDVRSIGSGNIGATNVLRTGRKDLAAGTLLLDGLKGTLAAIIGGMLWRAYVAEPNGMLGTVAELNEVLPMTVTPGHACAAVGALVGHCFPAWLGFKGGKGVATFLGAMIPLTPFGAAAFVVVWLSTAYFTKYSSLAALLAVGASPLIALMTGGLLVPAALALMGIVVFYRHAENIDRLRSGTERRIGGSA